MREFLSNVLSVTAYLAAGLLGLFFVCVIIAFIAMEVDYRTCHAIGTVKIDNKPVYTGRLYYVTIDSIGENGNTKKVKIYNKNDRYLIHSVKEYVSDKVEVK